MNIGAHTCTYFYKHWDIFMLKTVKGYHIASSVYREVCLRSSPLLILGCRVS